jgi:hypothetical protein
MSNLLKPREIYVDTEQASRDKIIYHNNLGGFYYGTDYALKNHANLTITRKNFLKLFPDKSSPQGSWRPSISPEIENSLFQSLSSSYSQLSPVERPRGWK